MIAVDKGVRETGLFVPHTGIRRSIRAGTLLPLAPPWDVGV